MRTLFRRKHDHPDTVLGAGTAGMNIARNAALVAGLPVTVPAQTVDRHAPPA